MSSERRRGSGVMCLALLGLTLGALGHVAVHAKHLEVAVELGREHEAQLRLQEQRRRLEIEIGMLKAPGQLIKVAREKLKMGPPAPGDIRTLETGTLKGFPNPPALSLRQAKPASANATVSSIPKESR